MLGEGSLLNRVAGDESCVSSSQIIDILRVKAQIFRMSDHKGTLRILIFQPLPNLGGGEIKVQNWEFPHGRTQTW